jgi:hypothetical protein
MRLSFEAASDLRKKLCKKCNIMNNKKMPILVEMNTFGYNCNYYCIVLFKQTKDEIKDSDIKEWRTQNNLDYKKMRKLGIEIYY